MNKSIIADNFKQHFMKRRIALLQDDSTELKRAALVAPAQDMTESLMNEMLELAGGHLNVAISPQRARRLMLSLMPKNEIQGLEKKVNLPEACVSVEARHDVSTGISAHDRAKTVAILGEKEPNPKQLVSPGHVFPIIVREGGVLVKNALPEAALDLMLLVEASDAAVFIDILGDDGDFISAKEQQNFAKENKIPLIKLSELVQYRLQNEQLVYKAAEAHLPSRLAGDLRSCIYKSNIFGGEHVALIKGEIKPDKAVLTRVQPESTFGDVFGGDNPPSRKQIQKALEEIGKSECGVLLYLRRPDRGYLKSQIENWKKKAPQQSVSKLREYGLGAQILSDLGVRKISLLSKSDTDLVGLEAFGIEIVT